MGLQNKYCIVGVGHTKLGDQPQVSRLGLISEAMKYAIEDAGLTNKDVDGLLTHNNVVYTHHTRVGELLGINPRFADTDTSGGASNAKNVAMACMAIDAGLCNTVVIGYGETQRHRGGGGEGRPNEFAPEFGYFGAISTHAFGCTRHMHQYGTTHDQLGAIAVAFRKHASKNPWAQQRAPITLEDYHNSRWVVWPFHLFDCCQVTDGAGAVVVTSAERAKDLRHPPVYIMGFAQFQNSKGWFVEDHMTELAAKESAEVAYRMAGVGPKDIDVAEIYDCFTYTVLATLEDYGFAKKGEGGPWVQTGALELDGELPTNTSGGQLSEGHTEGMLQIVEGVRQLRHSYGPDRQVKDCEIALVTGHGGNTVCHSTLILRR